LSRTLQRLRSKRWCASLFNVCVVLAGCRLWLDPGPSTAFFYGHPVPLELFQQYERVVVEADNLELDQIPATSKAQVFAYVSLGEAERWRAGHEELPKRWFVGVNTSWNSDIADLTAPGWRHYILEQRMATLWDQGYRGFFLDTLDSYRMALADPAAQAAQKQALVDLIREVYQRFPGVQLLFNRGFELLPEVGNLAEGIVAESLYYTWDAASQRYKEVDEKDRDWLLERLREANRRYGLPVTVIDYLPPDQRQLAREDAKRIVAMGFTPWVANPSLDILGVGRADLEEE
jgi:uncharacterized protein (TIGR01370 family)